MKSETVNLDFEARGSGTPVVLLHGFPFNRRIWEDVNALLDEDLRLILPDLRGHGRSPVGERTNTMGAMARDVAALLDRLGIEQVVVAGHSMGGYAALAFARLFPRRLLGLGLIASHPLADSAEKAASRQASAERLEREGLGFLAESMPAQLSDIAHLYPRMKEIILENSSAGAAAAQLGMAARGDETATLQGLKAPALIIAGRRDRVVSLETAEAASRMLVNGRLVVLDDAGHMPMLECPQETARAILELARRVQ
ncbi:hypothetical protein ADN00_03545 [Ornatilinea apprima]|uniref:AB hydrolase-1 domain-containing protein n=1 Tax=Ornatilinea apprima TaxID=1134406 RepID=A0A0N8GNT3_9CHLR|nr:alpha/beta hydrolase [Ornatilinea apprima]KPL78978.1 hypothetical protein ADN00_03545 [Ornatilinea apprima]